MAGSPFVKFLDYCAKEVPALEEMLTEKDRKEVVIADVGSSFMPYGKLLYEWASHFGKPEIYAVDPETRLHWLKKIVHKVPVRIEDSAKYFAAGDVSHIDLFTIFNPSQWPPLPDITRLGELSRKSLVLLTFGERPTSQHSLKNALERQGMVLLSEQFRNPYSLDIKKTEHCFLFDYNPVIIAQAP